MSCKGCSASVMVTDKAVQQMVDEQMQFETDLAEEELYVQRLEACMDCPSLLYGNTCSHCGCFVQFRARLAYKRCPYPGGAKW